MFKLITVLFILALKLSIDINHFNLINFAFSKRIGVTGTTIGRIANSPSQRDSSRKKIKPNHNVLTTITKTFNINPNYRFGKSDTMIKSEIAKNPTYSSLEKRLN